MKAVSTQDLALIALSKLHNGKSELQNGCNQVKTEVFSHLNIEWEETKVLARAPTGDFEKMYKVKLLYFAKCISLLILFEAKKIKETPRDWFRFCSIVTPVQTLGTFVRKAFWDHVQKREGVLRRTLMYHFNKHGTLSNLNINLIQLFKEVKLSKRILSMIASGVVSPTKKGVTIPMNINNTDAMLDQLVSVVSSLTKTDSYHTEPRHVQMDGFGFISAEYSPDGESVGLKMILALFATITLELEEPQFLYKWMASLFKLYLIPVEDIIGSCLDASLLASKNGQTESITSFNTKWKDTYYSYYNNCGILSHFIEESNVRDFISTFRKARRNGLLPWSCFLECYDERKEIHICCTSGQLARPLIVAENVHLAKAEMDLQDMIIHGIIEYVNVAEQQTICTIANSFYDYQTFGQSKGCTHIELNQVSILCPSVAGVPYVTSQHGPRVTHFSQQVKQKMTGDPKKHRGAVFHTQLAYAQKSLITTQTALNHIMSLPIGKDRLCTIALLPKPENQEDANSQSRASEERGLFTAFSTRYYTSDATTTTISKEQFERPQTVLSRKNVDFSTVQPNGIPLLRTYIAGGCPVIAKTKLSTMRKQKKLHKRRKLNDYEAITKRCITVTSRLDEAGVTSFVSKVKTPAGQRVTVGITSQHKSKEGEKLSNRYSGKGVIGSSENQEDLPYSLETGNVFDLYISPISPAARMTLSCLLEALTGKTVCASGQYSWGIDTQDFNQSNIDRQHELEKVLLQFGFSSHGTETLVCGKTGTLLKARVFCGVIEVSRLNHIASKKIHARGFGIGPRDPLTRQPTAGRINEGGLRVGEMEMSALATYGAAYNLQVRLNHLSDPYTVFICSECKMLADGNKEINYVWCRSCQSKQHVLEVQIPYTLLVSLTELLAMGIVVRIAVEKDDEIMMEPEKPELWLRAYKDMDRINNNAKCNGKKRYDRENLVDVQPTSQKKLRL